MLPLRFAHALLTLLFVLTFCASVRAQTSATGLKPAFETASIRPAHLTPGCFSALPPGGSNYALTCITVRLLIGLAFATDHIEGGGHALETAYDLRATTPDGQPWTNELVRPMLQQFLVERFHLSFHPGKQELSGYGLFLRSVPAKNGPKLQAVPPEAIVQGQKAGEGSQNFIMPGHVQGRGATLTLIAGLLSAAAHAPVVDHTGLPGVYNFDLSFAPDAPDSSADANLPSFFTAVEEQLGLKLKAEKVTVDTLVIDHIDREPTPN